MATREEICARLCLLTRAAWEEGLPAPMTRRMVRRLSACGALENLVLRASPYIEDELMNRARRLLGRTRNVYACMQAYEEQGYQFLVPEDEAWPQRLFALGAQMPQLLFARGNLQLLRRRIVSVAGSRQILPETVRTAESCAEQLAWAHFVMASGGAQGVDHAAQQALLRAGGSLILIPALPVRQLVDDPAVCTALREGRLLFLCDALPDEPFSSQKALMRNHTIYALGEAAIVVAARDGAGGSWQGATDCLRGGYTPIFTPDTGGEDQAGNRALLARGAKRLDLDEPIDKQLFAQAQRKQMDMLCEIRTR